MASVGVFQCSKTGFKIQHSSKLTDKDWEAYYDYNLQAPAEHVQRSVITDIGEGDTFSAAHLIISKTGPDKEPGLMTPRLRNVTEFLRKEGEMDPTYVIKNLMLGAHLAGIGHAGVAKIFGAMNIPPPVKEYHYEEINRRLLFLNKSKIN